MSMHINTYQHVYYTLYMPIPTLYIYLHILSPFICNIPILIFLYTFTYIYLYTFWYTPFICVYFYYTYSFYLISTYTIGALTAQRSRRRCCTLPPSTPLRNPWLACINLSRWVSLSTQIFGGDDWYEYKSSASFINYLFQATDLSEASEGEVSFVFKTNFTAKIYFPVLYFPSIHVHMNIGLTHTYICIVLYVGGEAAALNRPSLRWLFWAKNCSCGRFL